MRGVDRSHPFVITEHVSVVAELTDPCAERLCCDLGINHGLPCRDREAFGVDTRGTVGREDPQVVGISGSVSSSELRQLLLRLHASMNPASYLRSSCAYGE